MVYVRKNEVKAFVLKHRYDLQVYQEENVK